MSMNDKAREPILEQAAGWCAAHRAGDLSLAERTAFLAWLKQSPAHIEEYFGVAAAVHLLAVEARAATDDVNETDAFNMRLADDNIIPFACDEGSSAARSMTRTNGRKVRWRLAAACLVFFTLGVFAYAFRETLQFGFGDTYRTVQGQQGSWRLSDDSVLYLNTKSAATVHFDNDERVVKVHYGQARFRVQHENARRFRVMAGDAAIIAVGTEFDVYCIEDTTRITIIDGRVAVVKDNVPSPAVSVLNVRGAVSLGAGQQIEVGRTSISKPRAVDLEHASAWLQRRIVFERLPLYQVVEEFNRYSSVRLEIADPSLSSLEITGSFSAYDLESFLEFMRHVDGVMVEARPHVIFLRRRSPIA